MEGNVSKAGWILVLSINFCIAMYQIWGMMRDWEDRPLDVIETVVPKHEIPFPSITVCPEGSTLRPALGVLMSKATIDPASVPWTLASFAQVNLRRIEEYYMSYDSHKMLYYSGCKDKAENFGLFCLFIVKTFNSINVKINNETFSSEVLSLYKELEKTVGFFGYNERVSLTKLCNSRRDDCQKKFNFVLEEWVQRFRGYISIKIVKVYIHLVLLKTIQWMVNNRSNENIIEKFFLFMEEDGELPRVYSSRVCTQFSGLSEESLVPPPLPAFIDAKSLKIAEQNSAFLFNIKSQKYVENGKYISSTECNKRDYLKYMYSVYTSLLYFQSLNFTTSTASYAAAMMQYDSRYDLPFSSTLKMKAELDEVLNRLLKHYLPSLGTVSWSLKDTLDMLLTKGVNAIKQRAAWSRSVENYTSLVEKREVDSINQIPLAGNLWTSLDKTDEDCLLSVSVETDFHSICDTNPKCVEFCEKMGKTTKTMSQVRYNLMEQVSHPASYRDAAVENRPTNWLVPFCFSGHQLYNMSYKVNKQINYLLSPSEKNYGYKFCTQIKQMFTDAGICTTFNFPAYSDFFAGQQMLQGCHDQPCNTSHVLYPEPVTTERFTSGALLVLDTWALKDYFVSRTQDLARLTAREAVVESDTLNNFKVVIHGRNEAPMFYDYDSATINLKLDDKLGNSNTTRSYFCKIHAEVSSADTAIKDVSVVKRQCKFPDETEGIYLYKQYSEKNCLFECKVNIAKNICKCVPWDFPRLEEDQLCGMFGNICFQEEIVRLKKDMTGGGYGSPPCGCYPDCLNVKYGLGDDEINEDYTNGVNWLQLFERAQQKYETLKNDRRSKVVLNETIWENLYKESNQQQFLFWYITDFYRGKDSLLNPGSVFLDNLDIREVLDRKRKDNLALFYVDFDRHKYAKRTKILRVTFEDRISAIGGTLGIFTGFSVMTLLEFAGWFTLKLKKFVSTKS